MSRVCPYCEALDLESIDDGAVLRCRSCGRSSLAGSSTPLAQDSPASAPSTQPTPPAGPPSRLFARRRQPVRGAPAEVASLPSALAAIVVTVLFYGLLHLMPAMRFSDLFLERGWVPYVITLISFWALFLLGVKRLRLRREAAMLDHELVLATADGRLRPDDAGIALATLRAEPDAIADSFLARRLERALRHFESRRRVVEVVEFLAAESQTDESRIDASYGLVRVFVWVVPTLGFIGTVIGIGAAVAGFSATLEAASSLDGMKESIGSVTGGLGVAFDTTLLALVMSILIMFPANAVQRLEEAFLGQVDDYCSEHLVPRLADEIDETPDESTIEALARRLVSAMRASERREG
jgi:biopolymer transport protein ExbB/TolQ